MMAQRWVVWWSVSPDDGEPPEAMKGTPLMMSRFAYGLEDPRMLERLPLWWSSLEDDGGRERERCLV